MKLKKEIKLVILLFLSIFFLKILINYFYKGSVTYPDEACISIIAKHLAQTGEIEKCNRILNMASINNPMPLYSIIISPFYYLFKSSTAFIAIQIFNLLLTSLLTFPLYSIFKRLKVKFLHSLLVIPIILFLPQIAGFEHFLMTESFYTFISIFVLYFYLIGLDKNNFKIRLLALVLTIPAVLTRPYGFILPLAILVNETVLNLNSKNRKLKILTIVLLILAIIGTILFILNTNFGDYVYKKGIRLLNIKYFLIFLYSIKAQFNAFMVASFFIPIIIFIYYFFNNRVKIFQKVKYFFVSYIVFNFFISSQHIFGYLLTDKYLELLTRYMNVSVIFLLIVSITSLLDKSKYKINIKYYILFGIMTLSLLTFNTARILNIAASMDFFMFNKVKFLEYYLIITAILFFILFLRNKKRALLISTTLAILFTTIFTQSQIALLTYVLKEDRSIISFLKSQENKKLLKINFTHEKNLHSYIGASIILTDNHFSFIDGGLNTLPVDNPEEKPIENYLYNKSLKDLKNSDKSEMEKIFHEFDYVITQNRELPLDLSIKTRKGFYIYQIPKNDYSK